MGTTVVIHCNALNNNQLITYFGLAEIVYQKDVYKKTTGPTSHAPADPSTAISIRNDQR